MVLKSLDNCIVNLKPTLINQHPFSPPCCFLKTTRPPATCKHILFPELLLHLLCHLVPGEEVLTQSWWFIPACW